MDSMRYITTPAQAGSIVATRRKALRIPQQVLARQLGISQNRLSELEDSPEKLTLERLLAMLNLLGLELAIHERDAQPATRGTSKKVEW